MSKRPYDTPNYTQIPNVLLDAQLKDMREAELKVVLAVARKTFGWHKRADKISLTQLQAATGMSRQGVINGVESAVKNGYLARTKHGEGYVYSIVVNEIDYPQLVNEVDQGSQRSRPELVNEVDTQKKVKKTHERNSGRKRPNELTYVPTGEEFEEPKPKRRKKPKRGRKRDPLLDNEAIKAYKSLAHLHVPVAWRQDVVDVVTDFDLWEQIVKDWIGLGWNKANVKGMLEAYRRGGLKGRKGNSESAQERLERRLEMIGEEDG